jgi:undecaprenyl-diphosphatase
LRFDTAVISALRVAGSPADPIGPAWLEEAARDVTAMGSFTVLFAIVAFTACYLFLSGKRRSAYFLTVCSFSGAMVSTLLKIVLERPRPELTGVTRVFTSSFPSGHALSSAVVYFTVAVFVARSAGSWGLKCLVISAAVGLTFMVGISRIYLGVHYPSDVIAGWLIGLGWALLCWLVSESYGTYAGKARE